MNKRKVVGAVLLRAWRCAMPCGRSTLSRTS